METRDAHPIDIGSKLDTKRKAWIVTIDALPELPDDWGLLVAEAIHNLRGALDHLVWDLALNDKRRIPLDKKGLQWRTQFPICTVDTNWNTGGLANMIEPLSDEHRALIDSRQPYKGWNGPRPHPLCTLERLSNFDKHRSLQPVLLCMTGGSTSIDSMTDCAILPSFTITNIAHRPLNPGTEFMVLPLEITGPHPEVDVNLDLKGQIAFNDGVPVPETLTDIAAFVRDTLALFEADLASDSAIKLRKQIDDSHPVTPYFQSTVRWGAVARSAG